MSYYVTIELNLDQMMERPSESFTLVSNISSEEYIFTSQNSPINSIYTCELPSDLIPDNMFYDFHIDQISDFVIISIISNVTAIGNFACKDCWALTSVDVLNAVTIGESAFQSNSMNAIDIPNITSIGANAFWHCDYLQSINMPNVVSIGSGAFLSTGFTSITLPPSITTVGSEVFRECANLTSVIVHPTFFK